MLNILYNIIISEYSVMFYCDNVTMWPLQWHHYMTFCDSVIVTSHLNPNSNNNNKESKNKIKKKKEKNKVQCSQLWQ